MDYSQFRYKLIQQDPSWADAGMEPALREEYERYTKGQGGIPSSADYVAERKGSRIASEHKETRTGLDPIDSKPPLSTLFNTLAILTFIGSLVLCFEFWPKSSTYEIGPGTVAYTWSIIWLMAGIIQAGIYAAIASVLGYLDRIEKNTSR